jgi:hypothetical protein
MKSQIKIDPELKYLINIFLAELDRKRYLNFDKITTFFRNKSKIEIYEICNYLTEIGKAEAGKGDKAFRTEDTDEIIGLNPTDLTRFGI